MLRSLALVHALYDKDGVYFQNSEMKQVFIVISKWRR